MPPNRLLTNTTSELSATLSRTISSPMFNRIGKNTNNNKCSTLNLPNPVPKTNDSHSILSPLNSSDNTGGYKGNTSLPGQIKVQPNMNGFGLQALRQSRQDLSEEVVQSQIESLCPGNIFSQGPGVRPSINSAGNRSAGEEIRNSKITVSTIGHRSNKEETKRSNKSNISSLRQRPWMNNQSTLSQNKRFDYLCDSTSSKSIKDIQTQNRNSTLLSQSNSNPMTSNQKQT